MQTWFAVAAKPRSEALALEHLARQGYECLLPRARRMVRGVRGLVPRIECLFPGYLFLHADPELTSLAPVRSTRGVVGLVRFGGAPAQVPESAIACIRRHCDESDGLIHFDAPRLAPGQRICLIDGPLSGIEGVFVLHEGLHRVRVLLDMLGARREIVIPGDQVVAAAA